MQDLVDFQRAQQPAGNQFAGAHLGRAQQGSRQGAVDGDPVGVGPGATTAHTALETISIFAVQCDRRMIVQQRVDRLQQRQARGLVQRRQLLQRDGLGDVEIAGGGAAQRTQVGAATERNAYVFGQCADVSAIASQNFNFDSWKTTFHATISHF